MQRGDFNGIPEKIWIFSLVTLHSNGMHFNKNLASDVYKNPLHPLP